MNMKWKQRFYSLAAILVMAFGLATPAGAKSIATKPQVQIDPNNFVTTVDNPYFPLLPGTTFIYRGEKDGAPTRDVMKVLHQTKVIQGVTTTVVHHLSYEEGILVEDTFDWFAQDTTGNVWYFGENTKELDKKGNVVSTEGTWQTGVNGAQPGIVMAANPQKGDPYAQESAPGIAEDMAQVTGFKDSLCVKYGCFQNVLVTKEWSPLEPDVVEKKYYAKGVGFIFSEMVQGGNERSELVRIINQQSGNNSGDKND